MPLLGYENCVVCFASGVGNILCSCFRWARRRLTVRGRTLGVAASGGFSRFFMTLVRREVYALSALFIDPKALSFRSLQQWILALLTL